MTTTALLEKYRIGDLVQFLTNHLQLLNATDANTLKVSSTRTPLQTELTQLTNIWDSNSGSEMTPEVATLDARRDAALLLITGTTFTWSKYHHNPDVKNAAFVVYDKIAGYGEQITILRYQLETATLDAIIQDLNNELATHIETLGIKEWVDLLADANNQFNQKYLSRTQATAGHTKGEVDAQRLVVTDKYYKFRDSFRARYAIAQEDNDPNLPLFKKINDDINRLTEQYNDAVSRYDGNPTQDPPPSPQNPAPPTPPQG